jgi:dTDP-glucose pyrophosphorylase
MYNWKKTIISLNASIKDAVEVLTKEALRIVMVVDLDGKLAGTITDGDIRRALVNGFCMSTLAADIMKTDPVTATINDDRDKILDMMSKKGLLQIPILDSKNRIVGLEVLNRIISKGTYNNPIFLMAGGYGTRLQPLTNDTPKPLLNVGSRPILETIISQFVKSGFYNFYISTHFKSELIKDYFKNGELFGASIKYIDENEPLGTAGSLGLLPDNLPDSPIIVMNGDLLTKVDFHNLLDFHNKNTAIATMCVREYDFQVPFGVVNINENKVNKITEKPVHSFFVNAGVYVLNRELIGDIDGESKLDMTDLLAKEANKRGVGAFLIHEYWLDIGQMSEYEQANRDILTIFN